MVDFTKQQKELLAHESFITAILEKRHGSNRSKGPLEDFIRSAGGAALITVVVGGLATGIITHRFQTAQKERDFKNRIVELYSQTKLEIHKENLRARGNSVSRALEMLGKVISWAESRIEIDGPLFARRQDPEQELKNQRQQEEIRAALNSAWEEWEIQKRSLGLTLSLYFGSKVSEQWATLIPMTDEFIKCANEHVPTDSATDVCNDTRQKIDRELESLLDDIRENEPAMPNMSQDEIKKIHSELSLD